MTSSYLLFLLSGRLFGVKLTGAIEILPWRASRSVPMSYSYVEGLLDFRGAIYPVYNLNHRLRMRGAEPANTEQSIILLEENHNPFGIVVDGVVRMTRLDEQPPEREKVQGIDPQYVKGFVYDEDRLAMILDFERLFHAD